MKVIKKYTAIQLQQTTIDDDVNAKLTYGKISGPYYVREIPEDLFDTEEDAIKYAQKKNIWANWLILPVITFDNFTM